MREDTIIEPRAAEILDQVKSIFATKGFEGASMQDLARAAGMSAGNFYRYFPSKGALIELLVEREVDIVREKFAVVLTAPDTLAAFRGMVRDRLGTVNGTEGPIWAEIEAAASRRPEFADLLLRMETEIIGNLIAVFARISGLPLARAREMFTAHARLMMILVQGVCMKCISRHGPADTEADRAVAALVVRMIEHTLAEVIAAAPPSHPEQPGARP